MFFCLISLHYVNRINKVMIMMMMIKHSAQRKQNSIENRNVELSFPPFIGLKKQLI